MHAATRSHCYIFLVLSLLRLGSAAITKVACVGDSITDGSCCGLSYDQIYPVRLQEILGTARFEVGEYGILSRTGSKDCTPSYWDSTEYQDALAWTADIYIVMLGSNDAKTINWGPGRCSENFQQDMQDLLNSFSNLPSQPMVFAAYPPKVCPNPCCGISDDNVVNGVIPALNGAADTEIIVDTYEYTQDHCNAWYTNDAVHLNPLGALRLAELLASEILAIQPSTDQPTGSPSCSPSGGPSQRPTKLPTDLPSSIPCGTPSAKQPTSGPSVASAPIDDPSAAPIDDTVGQGGLFGFLASMVKVVLGVIGEIIHVLTFGLL